MALKYELRTQGNFLFRNRSFLPLLFILIGLMVLVYGKTQKIEGRDGLLVQHWELLCLFVCLIGFGIRVKTVGHTPPNTSGRNTKEGQIAAELNTTGLYSVVRHPLYLGNFFMWLGIAMLAQNFWFAIAFVFLYTVYYERIMYAEELFLIEKFEERYIMWSARTPAIIPNFSNYRRPKYPFDWRKILKKEKNGIVAVFILIWLFKFTGDSAKHGIVHFKFNNWFFIALGMGILYLILKVVKRQKPRLW